VLNMSDCPSNDYAQVCCLRNTNLTRQSKKNASRGPANAYHVWSTSVNAFVSYPAQRQTERTNERSHNSASLGVVIKYPTVCLNSIKEKLLFFISSFLHCKI